tara:strand:- start:267 stop:662 length:396 start_codon:yes stop_codon:yes gene_type:complete
MFDFSIFIWAVLGAALVQVLSFLWYSPYLFGSIWRKALRKKPEARIPRQMQVTSFVIWVVAAIMLGVAYWILGFVALVDHVLLAVLMCLTFTMPARVMAILYSGHSKHLIWVDGLYYLLSYVFLGLIFAIM